MTEENQQEAPVQEAPAAEAPIQEAPASPKPEFVQTEDPKVLNRINQLYRKTKDTERQLELSRAEQRRLAERLEKAEREQAEEKKTQSKATLYALRKEALAIGDHESVNQIDKHLIESTLAEKAETKPEPVNYEAKAIANQQASFENWLSQTPERAATFNAYISDRQSRPWLNADHPRNAQLGAEAVSIIMNPDFAGADLPEILVELDKRMGTTSTRQAPSVLSPTQTRVAPQKRLSEAELAVARKMGISKEKYLANKDAG